MQNSKVSKKKKKNYVPQKKKKNSCGTMAKMRLVTVSSLSQHNTTDDLKHITDMLVCSHFKPICSDITHNAM